MEKVNLLNIGQQEYQRDNQQYRKKHLVNVKLSLFENIKSKRFMPIAINEPVSDCDLLSQSKRST